MKLLNLFIFLLAFTFANAQSSRTFLSCENNKLKIVRNGATTFLTCYTYKTSGTTLNLESEGLIYRIPSAQAQQSLAGMLTTVKACGCYGKSDVTTTEINDVAGGIYNNSIAKRLNIFNDSIQFTNYTSGVTNSTQIIDGGVQLMSIYIPYSTTLYGAEYVQYTVGNYTADSYNGVALYRFNNSDSTLVLVGQSTSDGEMWKSATNTKKRKAFSTPLQVNEGLYFLGMWHNSSANVTTPAISAAGTQTGFSSNFLTATKLNNLYLNFNIYDTPTPPNIIYSTNINIGGGVSSHIYFNLY